MLCRIDNLRLEVVYHILSFGEISLNQFVEFFSGCAKEFLILIN